MSTGTRALPLFLGFALLGFVWSAPFAAHGIGPFTAHMLRHMTLVAVAAPLLVSGLPGAAAWRAVPPLLASAIEFAVVWGWHLPLLHDAARATAVPFALEQATFLASGLLVWGAALQKGQELAGAVALLLTSMHMTLLGALIVLSPAPLYLCTLEPGLALDDQRLGGVLMLLIGTSAYLVGGLALVRKALAPERASAASASARPTTVTPEPRP